MSTGNETWLWKANVMVDNEQHSRHCIVIYLRWGDRGSGTEATWEIGQWTVDSLLQLKQSRIHGYPSHKWVGRSSDEKSHPSIQPTERPVDGPTDIATGMATEIIVDILITYFEDFFPSGTHCIDKGIFFLFCEEKYLDRFWFQQVKLIISSSVQYLQNGKELRMNQPMTTDF